MYLACTTNIGCYYVGTEIFDKRYIFLAESIKPENFTHIPILNERRVMIPVNGSWRQK